MFIEIKNALKKYETDGITTYALRDIDLNIEQGKICVILGPSGSGKSTLLNMLGGIDKLDKGSIKIDGKLISKYNQKELTEYRRNDVGFIFQFYNLIPDLSVRENIEVISSISKTPLSVDKLLKDLEIEKYEKRFPKELSGGQQQRVAIARAMVKNPKLLLCDELTGALDTKSSKTVLNAIEDINEEYNTTIIIITHNEKIAAMADIVARIKDGVIESIIENKNKVSAHDLEL